MGKKRILVIDDEPDVRKVLRARLEKSGYEIIEAANGEEGLKECQERDPDLILLDVLMPKKDGYTFLCELKRKEKFKTKPVIVITAKPGMEHFFKIEDVSGFIVKPFEFDDVLRKIKIALKEN